MQTHARTIFRSGSSCVSVRELQVVLQVALVNLLKWNISIYLFPCIDRISLFHHICSNWRFRNAAQACAGAEAAYTRALTAASKVPLVGGCDGASLRAALCGFSDLPFMVGQARPTTHASALTQLSCSVRTVLLLACRVLPVTMLCSAAANSTWRHVEVVQGGKIAAWLSMLQGPLYFRSQMSPAMVTGAGWSSMEAQAL